MFPGEHFLHTLLVAEANRNSEQPENSVKASTGQGGTGHHHKGSRWDGVSQGGLPGGSGCGPDCGESK